MARKLRDDVCGGAEAVEPECGACRAGARRVARELQRAIADQSGAEQRRRLGSVVTLRDGKTVACIGERIFGIAAIARVASEECVLAEVFPSNRTIAYVPQVW